MPQGVVQREPELGPSLNWSCLRRPRGALTRLLSWETRQRDSLARRQKVPPVAMASFPYAAAATPSHSIRPPWSRLA